MTILKNDTRLDTLLADAAKLGTAEVKGKSALPTLALLVAEAARDGVIDIDPDNKEGDGIKQVYLAYTKAYSAKNAFAHSADGIAANVSKLRAFAYCGQLDTAEVSGCSVLARANAIHAEAVRASASTKAKVKSPYIYLLDVARKQKDQPAAELSDDELRAMTIKDQRAERTALEKLQDAYKGLHAIYDVAPSFELQETLHMLAKDIEERGGEVPDKKKAKEERALAALLAKHPGLASRIAA